jgi:hypothetical protein
LIEGTEQKRNKKLDSYGIIADMPASRSKRL